VQQPAKALARNLTLIIIKPVGWLVKPVSSLSVGWSRSVGRSVGQIPMKKLVLTAFEVDKNIKNKICKILPKMVQEIVVYCDTQ